MNLPKNAHLIILLSHKKSYKVTMIDFRAINCNKRLADRKLTFLQLLINSKLRNGITLIFYNIS